MPGGAATVRCGLHVETLEHTLSSIGVLVRREPSAEYDGRASVLAPLHQRARPRVIEESRYWSHIDHSRRQACDRRRPARVAPGAGRVCTKREHDYGSGGR
jgi:hypothetical protein